MRLFLAVPVPSSFFKSINVLQENFKDQSINFVKPENCHLTLRFFGELKEEELSSLIPELNQIISNHASFEIALGTIGVFHPKTPHVLWLGAKCGEELMLLYNSLPKKDKEFSPHVTIGRIKQLKDKILFDQTLEKFKNEQLGSFKVASINLYQSTLTPAGPIYKIINEFMLKDAK